MKYFYTSIQTQEGAALHCENLTTKGTSIADIINYCEDNDYFILNIYPLTHQEYKKIRENQKSFSDDKCVGIGTDQIQETKTVRDEQS